MNGFHDLTKCLIVPVRLLGKGRDGTVNDVLDGYLRNGIMASYLFWSYPGTRPTIALAACVNTSIPKVTKISRCYIVGMRQMKVPDGLEISHIVQAIPIEGKETHPVLCPKEYEKVAPISAP